MENTQPKTSTERHKDLPKRTNPLWRRMNTVKLCSQDSRGLCLCASVWTAGTPLTQRNMTLKDNTGVFLCHEENSSLIPQKHAAYKQGCI